MLIRLFLKTFALIFVVIAIPLFVLSRKIPAEDRPFVPLLEWRDASGQPALGIRWNGNYRTLSEAAQKIRAIENLDLSFRKLNAVPPEIGMMSNLQWLYLYNSDLAELPPEIGQLPKLWWVVLEGNNLSELPPELWQLPNLETLDLGSNNLTELPPEIGKLTNLRWLDLSGNRLTSLPKELADLPRLELLEVSNNPLPPDYPTETEALLEYLRNQ